MDWLVPTEPQAPLVGYMIVAAAAMLLTGLAKGGFGGLGILAVPLMMQVMDGRIVLGMWLPLLLVCDMFTLPHYPKQCHWRLIGILAPWTLVGIAIGYMLLGVVSDRALKILVGALAVGFVALEIARWQVNRWMRRRPAPWRPGWLAGVPFGLGAGMATILSHAAGPIVTMFLVPQRLDQRFFVGTCARYFLIVNAVKVPFLVHGAFITPATLKASIWLLPLAPVGVWLGAALNRRLTGRSFHGIILVLLALTGLRLVLTNVGAS